MVSAGFQAFLAFGTLALAGMACSQELSAQPGEGSKVCVAGANNHSAEMLSRDRMTNRLVKSVEDKTLDVVAMDSSTGDNRNLKPTLDNSEEMKSKGCDYLVLTRVSGPDNEPGSPADAEISVGHAKVPSVDASDPLGGSTGPVYRKEVKIDFAVFRPGNLKPILDTRIYDRPRANVSDSLMEAMDREGIRVKKELQKRNRSAKNQLPE